MVGLHGEEVHEVLAKLDQLIDSEGRLVGVSILDVVRGTQKAIQGVDSKVTHIQLDTTYIKEMVWSMLEHGSLYLCIISATDIDLRL